VNLGAASNAGRAQTDLPAANNGASNGEREEQIRFANIVVIEKIEAFVRNMSASRIQPRQGMFTPNCSSSSRSP
jgi:hypothetical protein